MISRLQTDSNQKQLTRTEEKVSKTIKETATTSIYELKEKHEARVFCLGHLATSKFAEVRCRSKMHLMRFRFSILIEETSGGGWG